MDWYRQWDGYSQTRTAPSANFPWRLRHTVRVPDTKLSTPVLLKTPILLKGSIRQSGQCRGNYCPIPFANPVLPQRRRAVLLTPSGSRSHGNLMLLSVLLATAPHGHRAFYHRTRWRNALAILNGVSSRPAAGRLHQRPATVARPPHNAMRSAASEVSTVTGPDAASAVADTMASIACWRPCRFASARSAATLRAMASVTVRERARDLIGLLWQ